MRLPPLPTLGDILRIYGIRARKSLSQNFILDPRTLKRLSACNGSLKGKTVIEVGPGPGGITRAILEQDVKRVYVIEKDTRFLPSLKLLQDATGDLLHIRVGDCLHYNVENLLDPSLKKSWDDYECPDVRLIGNLPFNVATPFIIRLLSDMYHRTNYFAFGRVPCILTFQHEVAFRMIAPPGDPERCRLSVMAQNYAKIKYKYTLPGGAFVPPPKVDVGVVVLEPYEKPYIDLPFKFVEKVVTTLMMHKNKKVYRTALRLFPIDPTGRYTKLLFEMAEVDFEKRPVDLKMNDFEKLCYCYSKLLENHKDIRRYVNKDVASFLNNKPEHSEETNPDKVRPKYNFVFE